MTVERGGRTLLLVRMQQSRIDDTTATTARERTLAPLLVDCQGSATANGDGERPVHAL